jgi:hypothetical protein
MPQLEQLNLFKPEPVPQSEFDIARLVLAGLEAKYPTRCEIYRNLARHLCHRNIGFNKYHLPNTVTVDDLWLYGNIQPDPVDSGWKGGNGNKWLGAVFGKGFARMGWYKSKIKGHHSRPVPIWTLAEYADKCKLFLTPNL